MGICFSQKNEIKAKRKQQIPLEDKSKIMIQTNDNPQSTHKEIAKNHVFPEIKSKNNDLRSPASNRTSIIDQKNSKEDILKSTLKQDKNEAKTDKNSSMIKVIISLNP